MLLLRANFAYHAGGVSGGRSPMSCIYEAWALVFRYIGDQMLIVDDLDMIAELARRDPMWEVPKPRVLKQLSELDEVELTMLAVRGMRIGHQFMTGVHDFRVSRAETNVRAVGLYLHSALPNSGYFLPETMFKGRDWMFDRPPQIKRLLDELDSRKYGYRLTAESGLRVLPPEEDDSHLA